MRLVSFYNFIYDANEYDEVLTKEYFMCKCGGSKFSHEDDRCYAGWFFCSKCSEKHRVHKDRRIHNNKDEFLFDYNYKEFYRNKEYYANYKKTS